MIEPDSAFPACFESRVHLAAHESRILLEAVRGHQLLHRPGQEVRVRSRFVIHGFAGWIRTLSGRQQIVQLAATGDLLLQEAGQPADPIVALTDTKTIDGSGILRAAADRIANPGLAAALDMMRKKRASLRANMLCGWAA